MNVDIPETYAVRYQPSGIAYKATRPLDSEVEANQNDNRHATGISTIRGTYFGKELYQRFIMLNKRKKGSEHREKQTNASKIPI